MTSVPVIEHKQSVFSFSAAMEPVLEVDPGALVVFETSDAFSGQIASERDLPSSLDFSRVNAATGPLAVRGAAPGDTLRVDILELELAKVGYQCVVPGFGVLNQRFTDPVTVEFVLEQGVASDGNRSYPVSPMIGTIGVAPAAGEVPSITPGDHGGNLDAREIGPGASLLLPVAVPGAQLAMGDVHAVQGDGEVCGVAVEVGARVRVRVSLAPIRIKRPVVVTQQRLITLASHQDMLVAAELAVGDMVDLLSDQGWDPVAAYTAMSLQGHLGIAQAVNPSKTLKMVFPRPEGWSLS